ncbi:hypothetical protein L1049_007862 [Liquidambar formosana]|uniref:Guanylate kinase 1 n=1 Tax=Liquidambar formosana TaxID=63359 RepID=A0AAP0X7U6_LIQFO
MGEAPALFVGDLQNGFSNGCDLKSKGFETAMIVGDKKYVIGGNDDELALSIGVRIFDKSTNTWSIPTFLGTKPKPCKGFSAMLLDEDRICLIKRASPPEDRIWFLEVDTQFVREQKRILGTDVVAWSKGVVGDAQKPIVISGPSGVGKGTLISKLMKEFPSMFGFSVSHTTRAPRDKEIDGVDYHFTERSVMEKDIKDGKFLEFASVHGNLYGTSVEAVEVVADAGKRCILDIDVQGARSVRATPLEAIFIFIRPPSFEDLEKRLRARGTETEEQIQKRLRNAKEELKQGESSGLFDYVLENDDLEDCYLRLKKLLGLDGSAGATFKSSPQTVNLPSPIDRPVAKRDYKILTNCGENLLGLDVSSLKGGAPGRTRGLKMYTMNSFSDGINGIEERTNDYELMWY